MPVPSAEVFQIEKFMPDFVKPDPEFKVTLVETGAAAVTAVGNVPAPPFA